MTFGLLQLPFSDAVVFDYFVKWFVDHAQSTTTGFVDVTFLLHYERLVLPLSSTGLFNIQTATCILLIPDAIYPSNSSACFIVVA